MYYNNQINPYMRTSYSGMQPTTMIQKNEFAWVQGEAGAKGFMVPPGMTMWLMDSENPVFYLKSTDMNGFPQPLRIFDFKERTIDKPVENPVEKNTQYVTRDEMKAYIEEKLKHESTVQSKPDEQQSNAEHVQDVATVSELPTQL